MSNLHIEALYTYPVKSCAPIVGNEFAVTDQGLEYDREWMVTRPDGSPLTQRNAPELALVKPIMTDTELILSAPSNGSVAIPLERDPAKEAQATPIVIFEKTGSAYNEAEEASDFLSDFLGKKVLLKRSVAPRPVNPKYRRMSASDSSQFADGFPFLLTSRSSLDMLNAEAAHDIPMLRFRPNIVVAGDELESYVEDFWREVQIGKMRAFIVKACERCPIPDVVHTTGKRDPERIVKQTLERTRRGTQYGQEKPKTFFGQNLLHIAQPGLQLQVGNEVRPLVSSRRPNFNWESAV